MRTRIDLTALRTRRFRSAARSWFAGAERRLRLARLHGQLAAVCTAEVDAITQPYLYPSRPPLTPEEREQVDHFDALGKQAGKRMDRLAPGDREVPFYEFIFAAPGEPS